jgi:hypothetical protein
MTTKTTRTQVMAAMFGLAAAVALGLSTELLAKGGGGSGGGGGGGGGSAGSGGKSGPANGGGGSGGGNSGGSGGSGSGGKSGSKASKSGGKPGAKPRCGEEQGDNSKESGERRCRDQFKHAREECDRSSSDAGSGK